MEIFIVEDNPDDSSLLEEVLQQSRLAGELTVAENGQEALHLLDAKAAAGRLPALIFLDLKLPGLSGSEVLQRIRQDQRLTKVVVAVLTSSSLPEEKERCYRFGADIFLSKPYGLGAFKKMVQELEQFFFSG